MNTPHCVKGSGCASEQTAVRALSGASLGRPSLDDQQMKSGFKKRSRKLFPPRWLPDYPFASVGVAHWMAVWGLRKASASKIKARRKPVSARTPSK